MKKQEASGRSEKCMLHKNVMEMQKTYGLSDKKDR